MKTKLILVCLAFLANGIGIGCLISGNVLVLIPCLLFYLVIVFTCLEDLKRFIKDNETTHKKQKP